MKTLYRNVLPYAFIAIVTMFACGCGNNTTPTVSSSDDEITRYLQEHPELQDAPEETVSESEI
jgi:hypothetical protein